MNRAVQIALVAVVVLALVGAGAFFLLDRPRADRESLYQVGTLTDLVDGRLDGNRTVGALLEHGDIGLGTFNALDGEMIVIDGKCYQARADGTLAQVGSGVATPFAQVSRFDADGTTRLPDGANVTVAEAAIAAALPSNTSFYVLKIRGQFDSVTVRSVPRQSEPYPPLADVIANQTVFQYSGVPGTMVGIWSPSYASGLSASGFHFHFISDDRTRGGHVLDFVLADQTVLWDATPSYDVDLV